MGGIEGKLNKEERKTRPKKISGVHLYRIGLRSGLSRYVLETDIANALVSFVNQYKRAPVENITYVEEVAECDDIYYSDRDLSNLETIEEEEEEKEEEQ